MKREKVLWCLLWTALVIGVSALISWCISWNLVMQQTGVPGKTLAGLPQAAQTAWLASANAGTYVLLPSGADAASAILQINADSNRTAVLATFDASGKAVSQNGSWHADGDGNLAVSLAPAADSSQPAELTFAIKNGSLTLKDPSGVSWNSANAALVKSDLPLESEWTLRETKLPDGSARTLNSAKPFIAALHADGTVSVQGDCNTLVGSFRLRANHAIGINLAASTRKFCSGSQEDNFTSDLNSAESYRVDGNTLVLNLPASGSMTFTRRIKQNAPAATLKPNSVWVWTGSSKP
ncbi:MAG TPA: META domain-containing protein, partial [Patescibacteria group bacterium]|nr:META domain-containing protein [Patescibacteria group bacterium]